MRSEVTDWMGSGSWGGGYLVFLETEWSAVIPLLPEADVFPRKLLGTLQMTKHPSSRSVAPILRCVYMSIWM